MSGLIAFRVSNFRSIAEEVELSLVALDDRDGLIEEATHMLLPAVGIYGPNASGKSALLDAIAYARQAITVSHQAWDVEGGTYRTPHRLGPFLSRPSKFQFDFVIDGEEFTYSFSVDDRKVLTEDLHQRTSRRPRHWFSRREDIYDFSRWVKGPKEALRELTRSNSLFLSAALQVDHPELSRIAGFFRTFNSVGVTTKRYGAWRPSSQHSIARRVQGSESFLSMLVHLTRMADLGIASFETRLDDANQYRLVFNHRADEERFVEFAYEDESEGTRTWLQLVSKAIDCLVEGGVMLLDEIDRSLHPHLSAQLLGLFQDTEVNKFGAQIIFTSHDVSLMRPGNRSRLRRDQMWLTEKSVDGATTLYAATDFKDITREETNLERLYLSGRLGAVPVVDQSELMEIALAPSPRKYVELSEQRKTQASLFDDDSGVAG